MAYIPRRICGGKKGDRTTYQNVLAQAESAQSKVNKPSGFI
jgi:hypothetical protein